MIEADVQSVTEDGLMRMPQVALDAAKLEPQVAGLSAASGPQVAPKKGKC